MGNPAQISGLVRDSDEKRWNLVELSPLVLIIMGSQGYVNLYFGQDFLKGGSTDYKTSDDNLYYESKDIGKLRWGNTVASAGWSYVMNHKMFSNISAYYTRYNSSIRRIEENQTGKKDDEEYKKSKRNTSTENGINDLGFRMNFDPPIISVSVAITSIIISARNIPKMK